MFTEHLSGFSAVFPQEVSLVVEQSLSSQSARIHEYGDTELLEELDHMFRKADVSNKTRLIVAAATDELFASALIQMRESLDHEMDAALQILTASQAPWESLHLSEETSKNGNVQEN